MALRYTTRKTVRAGLEECLKCLARADIFLKRSKYVESIESEAPGVYHVRFVWRKLGMTRRYDVVFRVRREGDKVIYESLEGSKYPMRLEFRLSKRDGETVLEASATMKAGLMADLLGRRDFAEFIDELVETGFVSLVKEMASRRRQKAESSEGPAVKKTCERCLLYDPVRKYCYYLRKNVSNPEKPPCGGAHFISAQV